MKKRIYLEPVVRGLIEPFFNMLETYMVLKHTTTLFSLSDHHILRRGWRVIVDQVQTKYHGMPIVL